MSNETQTEKPKKREVLTRFTDAELDAMKNETGADKDGTAVAAFARKHLTA